MLSFFLPGRNRKNHHGLRLTAILLMIALICPGVGTAWAAPVDAAPQTAQNSAKKEFTDILRVKFIQEYKSLWQEQRRDDQLKAIIDGIIDDQYGGLLDRYKAMLDSAVEPVQKAIEIKFNPLYDNFIDQLQDRFNEEFDKQLVEYFRERITELINHTKDHKRQVFLKKRSRELLANNAAMLKQRILLRLHENQPGLFMAKAAIGVGIALTGGAFLAILLGAAKGAATGTAILGVVLVGLGVVKIGYEAWNAPDKLKLYFEDTYCEFIFNEAPDQLWGAMEKLVQEGFNEVDNELQEVLRQAEELLETSEGKQISEGLSNEEKKDLSQRLTVLAKELRVRNTDPGLIKDFGEIAKNASNSEMKILIDMLQADAATTRAWLKTTDYHTLFELLDYLPKGIWKKYVPDEKSITTFRWMKDYLSKPAAELAANLKPENVEWIITGLPDKYLARLFARAETWPALEEEIGRLCDIPVKELRIPWLPWWVKFWPVGLLVLAWLAFKFCILSPLTILILLAAVLAFKFNLLPIWQIGLLLAVLLAAKFFVLPFFSSFKLPGRKKTKSPKSSAYSLDDDDEDEDLGEEKNEDEFENEETEEEGKSVSVMGKIKSIMGNIKNPLKRKSRNSEDEDE